MGFKPRLDLFAEKIRWITNFRYLNILHHTLQLFHIGAFRTKDLQILSFSVYNIEKTLAPRFITDLAKKLPAKYHDFLDVFSQTDLDKLQSHRPYDHKIPLIE